MGKLIAILGAVLILAGFLYLIFRIRRPRPAPAPVTPEQLRCNWRNFLIGLAAWLTAVWAGGSLVLFGILTSPAYGGTPASRLVPWSVAGAGILVLLAGRIWYGVSLFRLVRSLWVELPGKPERHPGLLEAIVTWVPFFGYFFSGVFVADRLLHPDVTGNAISRKMNWFCEAWVAVGWLAWMPLFFAYTLWSWWFWLAFYGWGIVLFGLMTRIAIRRSGGTAPLPPPSAGQRRKWRGQILVLVFVLLVTGGGWTAVKFYIDRTADRARQCLSEAGVPLTPKGMYVLHPIPEHNAYALYHALEAAWKRTEPMYSTALDPVSFLDLTLVTTPSPELLAAVESRLQTAASVTDLLNRLDPEQPMQFPRRWERGTMLLLPELTVIRRLAQLQCLRLYQALPAGNPEELSTLLSQLHTLRQWLAHDGLTISSDFAISLDDIESRYIEAILNRTAFPDAELQQMLVRIREKDAANAADWRRARIGDATLFDDDVVWNQNVLFRFPVRLPVGKLNGWEKCWNRLLPTSWILSLNRSWCRDYYAALLQPGPFDYARANEWDLRLNALPNYLEPVSELLPSMTWQVYEEAKQAARLRVTYTALAAELYRRKYGHWPERLTDLVPEFLDAVPLDPFDGQPLRCRRGELEAFELEVTSAEPPAEVRFDADEVAPFRERLPVFTGADALRFTPEYHQVTRSGFRVYSIGRDKIDSGGLPRPYGHRMQGGDITFTWYDQPQAVSR